MKQGNTRSQEIVTTESQEALVMGRQEVGAIISSYSIDYIRSSCNANATGSSCSYHLIAHATIFCGFTIFSSLNAGLSLSSRICMDRTRNLVLNIFSLSLSIWSKPPTLPIVMPKDGQGDLMPSAMRCPTLKLANKLSKGSYMTYLLA